MFFWKLAMSSPHNVSHVSFPTIRCIRKQRSRDCALADSPVIKKTLLIGQMVAWSWIFSPLITWLILVVSLMMRQPSPTRREERSPSQRDRIFEISRDHWCLSISNPSTAIKPVSSTVTIRFFFFFLRSSLRSLRIIGDKMFAERHR